MSRRPSLAAGVDHHPGKARPGEAADEVVRHRCSGEEDCDQAAGGGPRRGGEGVVVEIGPHGDLDVADPGPGHRCDRSGQGSGVLRLAGHRTADGLVRDGRDDRPDRLDRERPERAPDGVLGIDEVGARPCRHHGLVGVADADEEAGTRAQIG